MSRTKQRGALLLMAVLTALVAVAIFVAAGAWLYVSAAVIVLAIHLASPVDDAPDVPNHPFKVWLFVAAACGGVVVIVDGLTSGAPWYVAIGAFLLCTSLPALWMVRRGRNPWWMRGWADYSRRG